ncbi:MAG: carboxypeptidase regulatory-like domain-containing protein [Thermoplasmata archaeon]|nr:carboxypeptidase regulatory-like domain-containing protein [Thermoplasmata archaeon]
MSTGPGSSAAPHGGLLAGAAPAHAIGAAPTAPTLAGQTAAHNFPLVPSHLTKITSYGSAASSLTSPSSAALPTHTPAQPHPAVTTGTVTGRVEDSVTHSDISAAAVEYSPIGARCPQVNCSPVYTNTYGIFTFTSSPGYNVIYITQAYYAQNTTWVDVIASQTTNIGTIYLLHDAYVSGVVETTSGHIAIPGINVSSSSLNGTEFAFPNQITNGQGQFTNVPVLPVPSIVSFASTFIYSRYQGNFTWVSLAPYQHYNLGVVYIDAGIAVEATLVDSLHHKALTLGLGAAGQACSTYVGCVYQQGQISAQGGATTVVFFDGTPGPNRITFEADGYVANITQITLPAYPSNEVYNLGRINMVPESAIAVTVDFTWASQVAAAWAKWNTDPYGYTPMFVVSSTSLDGVELGAINCKPSGCNETKTTTLSGCGTIGSTVEIAATPLRNVVAVKPDTNTQCGTMFPTWPTTFTMPVFNNMTYANTTADFVSNIGFLNLTPGVFIQGSVTGGATSWSVFACSTDELGNTGTTCGPSSYASSTVAIVPYNQQVFPYDPPGCPQASTIFCVAAPIGPIELTFQGQYAVKNTTWAYVKPGYFPAAFESLASVTPNHISSVHLVQTSIKGLVLDALTHKAISAQISLLSSPAGGATYPSSSGPVNYSGSFFLNVTPGWDLVQVSAPVYQPNSTWVEVNRSTLNIGTINLTQDGFIHGFVLDPKGVGIPLAPVSYCPISGPGTCAQLGIDGLTSTNGEYFGQAASGLLPLGTYRVVVSAPGYDENFTWVNVTAPGGEVNASTLILHPAGNTTASPAQPRSQARTHANAQLVWVSGRLIDNSTKLGLAPGIVSLQANSPSGAVVAVSRINTGGDYNISLAPGAWWINATAAPYFYPASTFVNVSSSGDELVAPTLALEPFPWVHGRLYIQPWESVTIATGMGPGEATARTCDSTGICGSSGTVNSAGIYFETAPAGKYDRVSAAGHGTGPGQAPGGFVTNTSTIVTISNSTLNMTPLIGLAIFGAVIGQVRDHSTNNATPVRYGQVSAFAIGPGNTPVTVAETLNGGGDYIMLLPQNNKTTVLASGLAYEQANATDNGFGPGLSNFENATSLVHFGWVVFDVADSAGVGSADGVGRGRVGLAQVMSNVTTIAGVSYSYSNTADSFGLDNVSAPPGSRVTVSVQAPDFSDQVFNVSVNESQTTFFNDSSANPYTALGTVTLLGWSWLAGHVVDPFRNNLSLAQANIVVSNNASVTNHGPVNTNMAGYFLSDVPLGSTVNVSIGLPGYVVNKTRYSILQGITGLLSPINLTGDGVVAGYVYGYPTLTAVPGASVSICPKGTPACSNPIALTNGSGIFWSIAPPGLDALNVTDTNYVQSTTAYITVKPDSWNWIGAINLSEFAFIYGTVRGLPSGDILANANISLCYPNVFGTGPVGGCTETVTSNAQGKFFLPASSGNYIIDANATDYNDTYLPLAVSAGEYVPVGVLFLQEFGFETGVILGSDTAAPIAGSEIQACPDWSTGVCSALIPASSTGRFTLSGAPGPYTLFAIAPGYQGSYLATTFVSGKTVQLPPIDLTPTGTNELYTVSGFVSATDGFPIAGAIVSAGPSFATATDGNGTFALRVPWGTYTLEAVAPGFLSSAETVVVHATVNNVNLTLAPSTFLLSGTVRDGLTPSQVLQGVTISETLGGAVTTIAQTDSSGTYSVPLENGSHLLTASAGPALLTGYTPVTFSVSINGAPRVHDVLLFPPVTQVYGLVVDAVSGVYIANATVSGSGLTAEHVPSQFTLSTTGTGNFQVSLYSGSYTIVVSAKGYLTQKVTLTASGQPIQQLTISLPPSPPAGTAGGAASISGGTLALLGGVAAVAVAAMLVARRLSAASARGRPRAAAKEV